MRRRAAGCLVCLLASVLVPLLALLAVSGGSPAAAAATANFALMRFFRDLSRIKARRRRFGQKNALMPVLLGREKPLPLGDASLGLSPNAEELAEFDARTLPDCAETPPLLLAVRGRIYYVSTGKAFYGPGRSYHKLVGKDATRAFCTGCLEPACLIANTAGLSAAQLREAEKWIELSELHDKYKLVGQLREPAPEVADEGDAGSCDDAAAASTAAVEWELECVAAAEVAERS